MINFGNRFTDVGKPFALAKGDQGVALHLFDGLCRRVEFA
jgi:hypothetical protein